MAFWQILLLTLYSAYQILDELTIVSSAGSPVFAGFVTGLVMGDVKAGLAIGGGLQLMVLGVGTFGGASRIDATSGAVIATAFSVSQGIKPELAISTIAVPVAALLVYTDVLGRFTTTYFAHRVDAAVERFDYKGIEINYLLGAIPWALSRALPVFLALQFGAPLVEAITKQLAEGAAFYWLGQGLTLAGKMLPGVGFAILLRYLPVKKNAPYLILGFVLTAMLSSLYTGISGLSGEVGRLFPAVQGLVEKDSLAKFAFDFNGLPMIGISLIGFALAAISFKNSQNVKVVSSVSNSESGEIEDDEI